MLKKFFGKISKYLPHIVATLFLAGFVAYAWTEPSNVPPDGNVPAPINVGPTAQTKQGDLNLGGILKVEGNLLDKLGNIIYNTVTGKIERARLPFEQGDITSDVDTNIYDTGYFNVASLIPGNVIKGIAFGRGQTGTGEPLLSYDIAAEGSVFWTTTGGWDSDGAICWVPGCSWWFYTKVTSAPSFSERDPRNILNYQHVGSFATCYQKNFDNSCTPFSLDQGSYALTCDSPWQKYWSVFYGVNYCPRPPYSTGDYCEKATCIMP